MLVLYVPLYPGEFILLTTTATWRVTNADKAVMTSGQPGASQPCRFPILQSINYLDRMSQNVKKNKNVKNGGWQLPYGKTSDVHIKHSPDIQ